MRQRSKKPLSVIRKVPMSLLSVLGILFLGAALITFFVVDLLEID
jgi:hypothetical protein